MDHGWRSFLLALLLACSAGAALAQGEEADAGGMDDTELGAAMSTEEAARVLALPLPEDGAARYQLLQRQLRASQAVEDRARQIAIARQLIDAGRGRPGGEGWIRVYLSAEFTWGNSSKALAASDAFVSDSSLSLGTRAAAALRQAYIAAHSTDRAILGRLWSRADGLAAQAIAQGIGPAHLPIDRLQVRAEVQRWDGDLPGSLASLREAVGLSKRHLAEARKQTGGGSDSAVPDAYGWLDGSLGMLVYALVRQGRAQEAMNVAQANIALWRSGQLTDGLGARWNYRLATTLIATQQYEPGLAAALQADEMLARSGTAPTSHTRVLARLEIVRGLIGLRRWAEADEAYRRFQDETAGDALARSRINDNRLTALLAAKTGRLDEALEVAERSHRSRLRLYGASHPLTQEIAGVRAFVRLLRGDIKGAMLDYEALFAATLDTPGGWRDLDLRGVRGYVLGVAFGEFMNYIADRALKGEAIDPALTDRALQLADRSKLGATQRALTDSTARVLAATPALAQLLEQEQTQRQRLGTLFGALSTSLGQEDRLRRALSSEEFKALPPEQRRPRQDELKALREAIKVQQTEAAAARALLTGQREAIAQQFPAYADLITPTTPRPEQLKALLEPGEALVLVHPVDTATLVWLVGADGRRSVHASRLTAASLAEQVAELRQMLDLGAAPAGREPPLQLAKLHGLYRDLFGPLNLTGLRSLIVATDGPLASLPLGTLVTQPPDGAAPTAWLLREMAVTQLPAASALQALRRVKPTPAAKALLGFGDPLFNLAGPAKPLAADARHILPTPQRNATRYDAELGFRYADVPPLPDTRVELTAVALAVGADPKNDLVLGAAATRRAVLDANLLDRRVVAFATHGLMPGELPGISKPALAMAADRDERESPLLELDDVLSLRLNAQWVLLSACNTAAGEAGGAAMSGLVRGFFFAGARSVLATHWAVESASAAALSGATFKARGVSRAESLRLAQLAMIDGTLGAGRWAHPFYWAPYALFGDPQR